MKAIVIVGAVAALGAAYLYERSVVAQTGTPPGVPPSSSGSSAIPKNIADTMNNAWKAGGGTAVVKTRDQWIALMLPLLPGIMSYTQWGNVYDQGIGYNARFGTWANNDQVYQWVVAAAGG